MAWWLVVLRFVLAVCCCVCFCFCFCFALRYHIIRAVRTGVGHPKTGIWLNANAIRLHCCLPLLCRSCCVPSRVLANWIMRVRRSPVCVCVCVCRWLSVPVHPPSNDFMLRWPHFDMISFVLIIWDVVFRTKIEEEKKRWAELAWRTNGCGNNMADGIFDLILVSCSHVYINYTGAAIVLTFI